uniref:POM121 transmembrane nucleoporin n=1 Tax=Tetraodon nigroviridis TaxID=99883 RepID=H3CQC9_TETNG
VRSPVTVRIARPDHHTSPRSVHSLNVDHLSCAGLSKSPVDPCSRESVLKVLRETRKRPVEDEDRSFTTEQKIKGRRNDSGGSAHSAFKPFLPNGTPSQLVPQPGSLKCGMISPMEEPTIKRSRTSSISSGAGIHAPRGTPGTTRNAIHSSFSSTLGLSQRKRSAPSSSVSSPGSSRSQTAGGALKRPRREEGQSLSSASSVKSDQAISEKAPVPFPKVPVTSSADSTSSGGAKKRKIPLVPRYRDDVIYMPSPPQLGYRITAKDLDDEKMAAIKRIQKMLETPSECGSTEWIAISTPEPEKPPPEAAPSQWSSSTTTSSSSTSTILSSLLTAPLPTTSSPALPVIDLDPSPATSVAVTAASLTQPVGLKLNVPSLIPELTPVSQPQASSAGVSLPSAFPQISVAPSTPLAPGTSGPFGLIGQSTTPASFSNPVSAVASTSSVSSATSSNPLLASGFKPIFAVPPTATPPTTSAPDTAPVPTAATTSSSNSTFIYYTTFGATQPDPQAAKQKVFAFGQVAPSQNTTGASFGGFSAASTAIAAAATAAPPAFSFGKPSFQAPTTQAVFGSTTQATFGSTASQPPKPFAFGGAGTSSTPASNAAPAQFTFGAAAATTTTSFVTPTKPAFGAGSAGFAFGTGAPSAAPAAAPSFGASSQTQSATSGTFTFGTSTPTFGQSAAPAPIPFGSPAQGFNSVPFESGSSPTPSFSIGAGPKPSASTGSVPALAPNTGSAFQFGAAATTTSTPQPPSPLLQPRAPATAPSHLEAVFGSTTQATFGSTASQPPKPFAFGGAGTSSTPASNAAPAPFTFGAAAATTTTSFVTPTKPAFGAGSAGFAFGTGAPSAAPAAAPSFGASSQTQSATSGTFTFGGAPAPQTPSASALAAPSGYNFGAAVPQFGTPVSNSPAPQQDVALSAGTSTPTFGQSGAPAPIPFGSPAQGFNSVPFGSSPTPSFSIGAGPKPSGARQRVPARRQHNRKK